MAIDTLVDKTRMDTLSEDLNMFIRIRSLLASLKFCGVSSYDVLKAIGVTLKDHKPLPNLEGVTAVCKVYEPLLNLRT